MPLNAVGLQSDLLSLFANPAPAPVDLAEQWRVALVAYATGVIPISTGVVAAGTTLKATLTGIFQVTSAPQGPAMEAAFLAFATTIAAGMLPLNTGVVPPAPVGFATNLAPPFPATHAAAAAKWAGLIHAWMVTGSATLVAPPNTVIPAWS